MSDEVEQRQAWRQRLIEAVLKREFDDEVLVAMLCAGLDQAHSEGLADAADICRKVAESSPASRRVAVVLERAMINLIKLNARELEPLHAVA